MAANLAAFFIRAPVLLKAVLRADAPGVLWILAIPYVVLAVLYGWLLLRGPLESDLTRHRAADRNMG